MTREQVANVSSTIGNLIRISLAVEVEEAQVVYDLSNFEPLEIQLLDPTHGPETAADHLVNRQLLKAFTQFRCQLEMIRTPRAVEHNRHA
ncbi:MAG TPA: hypothetical protein VER17_02270 [Tepidisphaeraceae bacterium]|nr:hypothetical protein [Tepidisphaeraceae bacterium]